MSNNAKLANPMKVITGKDTRWSYANVWEAKSINGGTPKFSVSLIVPKSDKVTVEKIKAAIQAAYEEGQAKLKGNGRSVPPLTAIKTPLRDGDTERPDDPAYANAYFINANSATAPGIVDADCNPILSRSEVYSGVYGRASISFYAFNSNGNKGQCRRCLHWSGATGTCHSCLLPPPRRFLTGGGYRFRHRAHHSRTGKAR